MKAIFILFWIPYYFLIFINILISSLSKFLIIERGILIPEVYNIGVRCYIRAFNLIKDLLIFYGMEEDDIMAKIAGIRSDQIHEFVPKAEEGLPEPEKTKFFCKFLDVNTSAQISDQIYSAKGFGNKREELLRAGTQELTILRKGLVGWHNFLDEEGNPIEWIRPEGSKQRQDSAMDENLNKIPPEIRSEIADFIRGASKVDLD